MKIRSEFLQKTIITKRDDINQSDNDFNIYKESKISKIKEFESFNDLKIQYTVTDKTCFLGIKMISSMKIKYEFLQEIIIIKKDDIKDDRVWLQ